MIVIIKAEISKPINDRKKEALSTQEQIENHRIKNQDASNLFNNDEDNDDDEKRINRSGLLFVLLLCAGISLFLASCGLTLTDPDLTDAPSNLKIKKN